jgi:hypothetical protein
MDTSNNPDLGAAPALHYLLGRLSGDRPEHPAAAFGDLAKAQRAALDCRPADGPDWWATAF